MRLFTLVAAVICAATTAAAVAGAQAGTTVAAAAKQSIVVRFENIVFSGPSESCPVGIVAFDLFSESGDPAGTGTACIKMVEGCSFSAGCRDVATSVFTLRVEGGSVTARMSLDELWLSDTTMLQVGKGKIRSGTGDFARAQGRVEGGGIVRFADSEIESGLVYAIRIR
jgi:hypothetical protein